MKRYVKKPIPIEAVQWTGDNRVEVLNFCNQARFEYVINPLEIELVIHTLEGKMTAKVGDYIIKGVRGEFYPCAREIFEETYEEVTK